MEQLQKELELRWQGAGGVALGPILLVTAAIAGVVAGMVLLWNKSESFRDFITGIIDTVKVLSRGSWTESILMKN